MSLTVKWLLPLHQIYQLILYFNCTYNVSIYRRVHRQAIARLCHLWPFHKKGQQLVSFRSRCLVLTVAFLLQLNPHVFCPTAVSGSSVPEWIEFVVVWLPTSNGFLNCIFYFWINRSFRRKFHLVLQRLALALCPKLADSLGYCSTSNTQFVSGILDKNSVYERSSSVSSTCTLLSLA